MESFDQKATTFFLAYKDISPCWPIICCALLMASISVVGVFLNVSLILVTALTKSLHGTANIFLAFCSFFEVLHELGHFFFLSTALSGHCFVPYQNAFRILALSLFGLSASTLSMLFIGFDRLFCVIFPIKYNQLNLWPYVPITVLFCTVPSVALVLLYWRRSEEIPSMEITGNIGDLLTKGGYAYSVYADSKFACNSATIFVYVAVAFFLRIKQRSAPSSAAVSSQRHIFFSLLLIVLFNIGGYFLISVFYLFLPSSADSQPITFWFLRILFSVPANLSGASNAPILFVSSFEYRKAFRKQLKNIHSLFFSTNQSSVHPTLFALQPANNQPMDVQNVLRNRRGTFLAESANK
ncbi:hypothetical protein niasHS_003322 [Heterodera schachtii]|uniref:G-protein coupled receptors family 1 profile domain-containing protein n=1 Tax=Heterodera schachtii TaxID=97005 RepID=A0ABD2KG63_HETSC